MGEAELNVRIPVGEDYTYGVVKYAEEGRASRSVPLRYASFPDRSFRSPL